MSAETWKRVVGWPYEVSDHGRVRRAGGTRILKTGVGRGGYMRVQLNDAPRTKLVLVHHLVAAAFLLPPSGPIGRGATDFQINHKNGEKPDNTPANLEWVTPHENHVHAALLGLKPRGASHHNAKLSPRDVRRIRRMLAQSFTRPRIARQFGVTRQCVGLIARGKTWTHVGGS